MQMFEIDDDLPVDLRSLAWKIGELAEAGWVVALDEFQYFNRGALLEFTSHLQAVVDRLSSRAETVHGGLIVLGSSSSPLRTQADNGFLRELRGWYDLVLKYIATHPGCTNGEIVNHAINEDEKVIRLGHCKSDPDRLERDIPKVEGHVRRFLESCPAFSSGKSRAIAPRLDRSARKRIAARGFIPQDLRDLVKDFPSRPPVN